MRPTALVALLAIAALPAPAWPAAPDALPSPGMLRLPVPARCVSSGFGPRRQVGPRAATVHTGIDLPAAAGTWVVAAAPGQVVALRRSGALGLEIDLQHQGYVTRYAHLGTVAPSLAGGKRSVQAGERLGRVGRTGVTYGTHLHFEIRRNGKPEDAAPLFSLQPCG